MTQATHPTLVATNVENIDLILEFEKINIQDMPQVGGKNASLGEMLGQGPARVIQSVDNIADFQPGEVLITQRTDPD